MSTFPNLELIKNEVIVSAAKHHFKFLNSRFEYMPRSSITLLRNGLQLFLLCNGDINNCLSGKWGWNCVFSNTECCIITSVRPNIERLLKATTRGTITTSWFYWCCTPLIVLPLLCFAAVLINCTKKRKSPSCTSSCTYSSNHTPCTYLLFKTVNLEGS